MQKEKIVVDLGFALLTAEKEPDSNGISICLEDRGGTVIQDITLVTECDEREVGKKVRCLVWNDSLDESYTHSFTIPMYEEPAE